MRGTQIIFAHPATFALLASDPRRFSATRHSWPQRLYAAWLVFTGKADALMWLNGETP